MISFNALVPVGYGYSRGPVVGTSQLPIGLETSLSAVSQDGIRVLVPAQR